MAFTGGYLQVTRDLLVIDIQKDHRLKPIYQPICGNRLFQLGWRGV
jgi:hypothetical protein